MKSQQSDTSVFDGAPVGVEFEGLKASQTYAGKIR